MSTAPRRRRHSAAVYRRRRLAVVLIALLVIGAGIAVAIWQPWRTIGDPGAAPVTPSTGPSENAVITPLPGEGPTVAPTSSPVATAAPSGTPEITACDPDAITVEARTDKETYSAGQKPQLSISLTNTSAVDCTLDVGTAQQVFTITSGSDVWWRSTDCQKNPTNQIVTLTAAQSVTSQAPLVWDRTRSSPDTCDAKDRPVAPGGGATYNLSVEIAGISSAANASFMLY
ncbi:hypothetical protein [Microbacterium gorillae]|uniref:hypothetical protein n=1 Tax=Microbacterium gorillae TaxID=1231063 RepID=UPI000693F5A7|nr:hypothetical protein [Microbacterium gorillae]